MLHRWLLLILIVAPIAEVSAAKPSPQAVDHFFTKVRPLLASKCVACHGEQKQEGSLRLDSAALFDGGDSGPAVVPGDPNGSLLIQAVKHTHETLAMPPKDQLAADQVEALAEWIKTGAIWLDRVRVLFDDEPDLLPAVAVAKPAQLISTDAYSGKLAFATSAHSQRDRRPADWQYSIAEHPGPGQYRYLRVAWKTSDATTPIVEVASAGSWRAAPLDAQPASNQWTTATVDLWKHLGQFTLSGIALNASGQGQVLFDSVLLGSNLDSLDAYAPGRGELATPPSSGDHIGDAWHDPRNPIVKIFGGQRLDLWSLRKPVRRLPPMVTNKSWSRTPVDRFVLAKLEERSLSPSVEADRRTLIRRVTLDLTGLPPTPEDVSAFLLDNRPDAYEQLVDRLLSSPAFGEHWARRWLDVVRYSDTNGFERDEYRPTMYRYRDYVVRSLNSDKPYDEFLREQLAGDEMPSDAVPPELKAERLIATGYLRLGPHDTTTAIFEEDAKGRDQLMADLVNTTGSAMLGLTMSCCRCHDHKYDPLSQTDHYRMQAFFAAVSFREHPASPLGSEQEAAGQEIVTRHLKAMTEKPARAAALLAAGRERVQAERLKAFPADIQALLTLDATGLSAADQAKLKPYSEKLAVKDADARAALSEEELKEYGEAANQADVIKGQQLKLDCALGMTDSGDTAPPTHVLAQGDYQSPREEVQPGVLSILDPNTTPIQRVRNQTTTRRRTALADWITSRDNPFTARVIVNRLWQQYFGRGIVATPSDFGYSGVRPTHPELLDWLATELVQSGWSLKHIHRLIVASAVYRQASADDASRRALDPENLLLWRQTPRRLDAESLRDAMLAVSGTLLDVHSGPPRWPQLPDEIIRGNPKFFEVPLEGWSIVPDELADVRTMFTVQKRSLAVPLLETFDLPDNTVSCARRNTTIVAPQALTLLNSPFAVRMVTALANRTRGELGNNYEARIKRSFALALLREPSPDELELMLALLDKHAEAHRKRLDANVAGPKHDSEAAREAGMVDVCRVLLNLNEFIYID